MELKGLGLGLAIASRLAAAQGGDIEVQSHLGERTTFTVHLPIADFAAKDSATSVGRDQ